MLFIIIPINVAELGGRAKATSRDRMAPMNGVDGGWMVDGAPSPRSSRPSSLGFVPARTGTRHGIGLGQLPKWCVRLDKRTTGLSRVGRVRRVRRVPYPPTPA